jgi:2-polyprenyl-3-methyl-5-hydroxy-6-metoxy-1,4-benzoquinol methylase
MDLGQILGSTKFDVAIFGDVLEHLRDPLAVLVRVKPYLASGGFIVASIPNVTHASLVLELMHGRFSIEILASSTELTSDFSRNTASRSYSRTAGT